MAWTATVLTNTPYPTDSAKLRIVVRYTDGVKTHDVDYPSVSSREQLQSAVDAQIAAYEATAAISAPASTVLPVTTDANSPYAKFWRAYQQLQRFDEAVRLGLIDKTAPAYVAVLDAAKAAYDPRFLA
jgi:hypothetical protein